MINTWQHLQSIHSLVRTRKMLHKNLVLLLSIGFSLAQAEKKVLGDANLHGDGRKNVESQEENNQDLFKNRYARHNDAIDLFFETPNIDDGLQRHNTDLDNNEEKNDQSASRYHQYNHKKYFKSQHGNRAESKNTYPYHRYHSTPDNGYYGPQGSRTFPQNGHGVSYIYHIIHTIAVKPKMSKIENEMSNNDTMESTNSTVAMENDENENMTMSEDDNKEENLDEELLKAIQKNLVGIVHSIYRYRPDQPIITDVQDDQHGNQHEHPRVTTSKKIFRYPVNNNLFGNAPAHQKNSHYNFRYPFHHHQGYQSQHYSPSFHRYRPYRYYNHF